MSKYKSANHNVSRCACAEVTLFLDVLKNPGPDLGLRPVFSRNGFAGNLNRHLHLHNRQMRLAIYSRNYLFKLRVRRSAGTDRTYSKTLKENGIFMYRGKLASKKVRGRCSGANIGSSLVISQKPDLLSDINKLSGGNRQTSTPIRMSTPSLLLSNVRSLQCKVHELECAAAPKNTDIVCLTES